MKTYPILKACSLTLLVALLLRPTYALYYFTDIENSPSAFKTYKKMKNLPETNHTRCCTPLFKTSPAANKNFIFVSREAYDLLYDPSLRSAVYTIYRLKKGHLSSQGHTQIKRKTNFRIDPDLNTNYTINGKPYKWPCAKLNDYTLSGYQRGHLVPADDMKRNQNVQNQAFYLSNILPQNQSCNQSVWKKLENKVREYAKKHGKIYVITGPTYFQQIYITRAGRQVKSTNRLPKDTKLHGLKVPITFYKVLIRLKKPDKCIVKAYEVPNDPLANNDPENYVQSLKVLSKHANLKFIDNDTFNIVERTNF